MTLTEATENLRDLTYVTTTITPEIKEQITKWRTITTTEILPCDTFTYAERFPERKLQPVICENCGGRIDRDTMTCCYCGTFYR